MLLIWFPGCRVTCLLWVRKAWSDLFVTSRAYFTEPLPSPKNCGWPQLKHMPRVPPHRSVPFYGPAFFLIFLHVDWFYCKNPYFCSIFNFTLVFSFWKDLFLLIPNRIVWPFISSVSEIPPMMSDFWRYKFMCTTILHRENLWLKRDHGILF